MKKILTLICIFIIGTINATDRKFLAEVDTNKFTEQSQTLTSGIKDDHIAMTWWVPVEFWQSIMARDATTSESDKKAMLDALSGVTLMAVVQADVSRLGAFDFYTRAEIEENLLITSTKPGGQEKTVKRLDEISPDLEVVLGIFKPILGAAMGNLGNNFHFYVLNDQSKKSEKILNPYEKMKITTRLARRDGEKLLTALELPIDALFIPRKCPNGKDAHITWEYCPWSGKKLKH